MPEPRQGDMFHVKQSGEELRDQALTRFEENHPDWLYRARAMMVQLMLTHPHLDVTSDQVWAYCPPPADAHPSVMGAVFKDRRFVQVGWQASQRPSAHARVIRVYRLRGTV